MRGYFSIGLYHPKHSVNQGTLWRSAYQLGASDIFTIGSRYQIQSSDTLCAHRHIPCREYEDFNQFVRQIPTECQLVAVEMGGQELHRFTHPLRCVYLLGAEDHGLPPDVLEQCDRIVSIPAIRMESFNVSVAGAIVMYDRLAKAKAQYSKIAI